MKAKKFLKDLIEILIGLCAAFWADPDLRLGGPEAAEACFLAIQLNCFLLPSPLKVVHDYRAA
eukprot:5870480-Amphidinium_carterae.3